VLNCLIIAYPATGQKVVQAVYSMQRPTAAVSIYKCNYLLLVFFQVPVHL